MPVALPKKLMLWEKSSEVVGILLAIAKRISESCSSKGNCEDHSQDSGPRRCFTALKT